MISDSREIGKKLINLSGTSYDWYAGMDSPRSTPAVKRARASEGDSLSRLAFAVSPHFSFSMPISFQLEISSLDLRY